LLPQVTTKIAQIQKDTLHRQIPKNTSLSLLVTDWKNGHKGGGHRGIVTTVEEAVEKERERLVLQQQKQKTCVSNTCFKAAAGWLQGLGAQNRVVALGG
jgi:hypothetical protein